jgi:hypothetical protein
MAAQEGRLLRYRFVITLSSVLISVVLILFVASVTPVTAPPPPPKQPYIVLTADPSEIVADGSSTSTINASVWEWNEADEEYILIWLGPVVNFSTDLGEITASAQIENGTATAILTAGTEPGVATITADANLVDLVVTNTTTVNFTAAEFDTGAGEYPSISGIHEGFIVPNHTIIVKKMYTYPCAGTGGHTEYVEICNVTSTTGWCRNGTWKGYQEGNYHNITFPGGEEFTLMKGGVYNYTIFTGSYPRIIHKQNRTTLDGSFINCTSFVDANGKKHEDWLPAFRLGQ